MRFFLPLCLQLGAALASAQVTVAPESGGDFNGSDDQPIRAAIAQVRSAGGGEIFIRRGVYTINHQIELKDAKSITFRGEAGAILKLPPLQHAETTEAAAVGATSLVVKDQVGLVPGIQLRIMAPGAVDAFSKKPRPTFFVRMAQVDGDRLVLAKPLEFPVPAGTQIMNEDAPNLFDLRGNCEDIVIEGLTIDGGRTANDPVVSGHAQLCGLFASGNYNYTDGPKLPLLRHVVVRDCTIRNCFGRGVALYAVADGLVENCTIEDTVDEAVDLDHFDVACRVIDNQVARCGVGVELNDANECWVAQNRFEACNIGINLWRWCKMPDLNVRNQILDNLFLETKANGLQLQADTAFNVVRGNIVRGSGRQGIVVNGSDTMVTNNFVLGAGTTAAGKFCGIALGGTRNAALDNVIRDDPEKPTMRKPLSDDGHENVVRTPSGQP